MKLKGVLVAIALPPASLDGAVTGKMPSFTESGILPRCTGERSKSPERMGGDRYRTWVAIATEDGWRSLLIIRIITGFVLLASLLFP